MREQWDKARNRASNMSRLRALTQKRNVQLEKENKVLQSKLLQYENSGTSNNSKSNDNSSSDIVMNGMSNKQVIINKNNANNTNSKINKIINTNNNNNITSHSQSQSVPLQENKKDQLPTPSQSVQLPLVPKNIQSNQNIVNNQNNESKSNSIQLLKSKQIEKQNLQSSQSGRTLKMNQIKIEKNSNNIVPRKRKASEMDNDNDDNNKENINNERVDNNNNIVENDTNFELVGNVRFATL